MSIIQSPYQIFALERQGFLKAALEVFRFQAVHCTIYKQYIQQLGIDINQIKTLEQIPFLPIQFFKTHKVVCSNDPADILFESSATTGQVTAKHYVQDKTLYEQSILQSFEHAFGPVSDQVILGLLPHYLERKNSSLIYMVNYLMQQSGQELDGFFLDREEELFELLLKLEKEKQPTILFGVTFALLDVAQKFKANLKYTQLVETGGMKGRKKEMSRQTVHEVLHSAFGVKPIFSEYGMAELLSQSYYKEDKYFYPPVWKKAMVRDVYDPLHTTQVGKGVLNIIDLANAYSCSFIATDDLGRVNNDGTFDVLGRIDSSEVRGCNLLLTE